MLCGRAAVVTDVGGNAEWIEDGQTGFVAEAATAKSFGAALERAWLARGDWGEMGIRARHSALRRFGKSPGKALLKIVLAAAEYLRLAWFRVAVFMRGIPLLLKSRQCLSSTW